MWTRQLRLYYRTTLRNNSNGLTGKLSRKRPRSFSTESAATIQIQSRAPAYRQSGDSLRALFRWTETMLHPAKNPIGTLSPMAMDDVCDAIDIWIGGDTEKVVPRYINIAHRLLERLLYESTLSPLKQQNLEALVRSVFVAWLKVAQEYPNSTLSIRKVRFSQLFFRGAHVPCLGRKAL